MPAVSAPVFGAVLGVGVQLYVNAVRKYPLMRTPWMHVAWAGAGAAFGTWLVDFEERTEKDLTGARRVLGAGVWARGATARAVLCCCMGAQAARARRQRGDGRRRSGAQQGVRQRGVCSPAALFSWAHAFPAAAMLKKRDEANKRLHQQ